MFNYQIIIEYDGTNFVGWQKQKNGHSIQQTIENILTKILKKKLYFMVLEEQTQASMLKVNRLILV